MELTAHATRSGGWWAVEVPEVPGLYTQAKRLDQITDMVRDAAAALTGEPENSFTVTVVPSINGIDVSRLSQEAREARAAAREAERAASDASSRAIAELREAGLPVRDVGTIIGISPQRVSVIDSQQSSASRSIR